MTEIQLTAQPSERKWWQGLAARIMLSTSALALAVIFITSAISYNALRDMSVSVANQALEGQANTLRHDLEARVLSLSDRLKELSQNALIANALVDDVGRTVYLRDFIGGLSSAEGFEITVVMTNFLGKPLASNNPAHEFLLPATWVSDVVDRAQGKGAVFFHDDAPYLVLAEPIIYRNTGTAEGALIFQIRLDAWLNFEVVRRIFLERPWLSQLALLAAPRESTQSQRQEAAIDETENSPHISLPLSLPETVTGMPLKVDLSAKASFVQAPLDKLLTNVTMMSTAIFIAALLGSLFLSRRLTRKLARLRLETDQIAQAEISNVSFTSNNMDEIDDLAIAFNALVDELHDAYRQLEDQSQREIEVRERRYQGIINSSAEGIITISSTGIIETFNPSAERIFGYAANEVIGQNVDILMPQDERAAHAQYLRHSDLHAPRIINRSRDLFALRKDGTTFALELNVSPMELNGKQKFIGIMRDISDRKEFEERINAARVEAEQANLAKSQFLSSMSHELRTPLNAVLGFGQLLEMDIGRSLSPSQGQAVTQILKGGRYLLELIDQVLNLAKIESGNLSVNIENVDITPLLNDAMAMARTMADKRDIQVECTIPDKNTTFVRADSTRLHQVLLNLLSNAIKYNHKGGSLSLRYVVQDDTCRIEIQDTGPGIAEDLHEHVFTPFHRLGAEGSDIEGTGIGLTITRELVLLMNGNIGFTSAAGKGTTFWFELPLSTADTMTKGTSASSKSQGGDLITEDEDQAPLFKVLYIEDNLSNLQLMKMVAEKQGHMELLSAEDAEKGIEIAKSEPLDLILMDIHLPGMNGMDAMLALRSDSNTASIPVIAVSANAMADDIQRALDAGFDNYLTKPINITKAIKLINETLG